MDSWYVFILVGLLCGVFSAFLGVGSGIIMVPVLALAFQFSQKSAQGMSLAVMVPMALVGAVRYKLNPSIGMDLTIILLMAAGAVVGAWLGASLADRIPAVLLRRAFAAVMVVAAIQMFRTADRDGRRDSVMRREAAHASALPGPRDAGHGNEG